MLNDKPCDGCDFFDQIVRGKKNTKWAWCAKKSVYPHKPGPGQLFPAGVKRMSDPKKPAEPVIVSVGQVVGNCLDYKAKTPGRSKVDLIEELHKRGGKRVIT